MSTTREVQSQMALEDGRTTEEELRPMGPPQSFGPPARMAQPAPCAFWSDRVQEDLALKALRPQFLPPPPQESDQRMDQQLHDRGSGPMEALRVAALRVTGLDGTNRGLFGGSSFNIPNSSGPIFSDQPNQEYDLGTVLRMVMSQNQELARQVAELRNQVQADQNVQQPSMATPMPTSGQASIRDQRNMERFRALDDLHRASSREEEVQGAGQVAELVHFSGQSIVPPGTQELQAALVAAPTGPSETPVGASEGHSRGTPGSAEVTAEQELSRRRALQDAATGPNETPVGASEGHSRGTPGPAERVERLGPYQGGVPSGPGETPVGAASEHSRGTPGCAEGYIYGAVHARVQERTSLEGLSGRTLPIPQLVHLLSSPARGYNQPSQGPDWLTGNYGAQGAPSFGPPPSQGGNLIPGLGIEGENRAANPFNVADFLGGGSSAPGFGQAGGLEGGMPSWLRSLASSGSDSIRTVELQKLPEIQEGELGSLAVGDWIALISPTMRDLSGNSSQWWDAVLQSATAAYAEWLRAEPLQRLYATPIGTHVRLRHHGEESSREVKL